MKERQYRSNQGRSPRQQRGSYIIMMIAVIGMILSLGIFVIVESIKNI